MISKKFYSRFTPEQLNQSTGLLLGTGPYKMPDPESWRPEPGKDISVLVRNPRYWGAPGGPDRLVWKVIQLSASVRMTTLRNGEADMFYQPAPEQFNEMKKDPKLSAELNLFTPWTPCTAGYQYIGWNQKRGGKPTYFARIKCACAAR